MLSETTCVTIGCDTCGRLYHDDDGDGFVVHYDSVEEAEDSVRGDDWIVTGDRVTCRECADRATCDLTGHDWGEWNDIGPHSLAAGGIYVGRRRWCCRCNARDYDPPIPTPEEPANA